MSEPKKWWEKLLLFVIMPIFDCFKRIVKSLIENKLILLLAGVYIIFHELFEELCTAKVVKYILSKCVSSSWNDVVFGIILLWAAILSVYRLYKRFHISDKRILISLILLFAWCYYRFIEHVWAFEPFTFWSGLKYVDAIAAFLMGSLLVRVFSYKGYVSNLLINIASYLEPKSTLLLRLQRFRHFKKNKLDNEPKGFCLDAPLSESGTDSLNREKVVEQICQRIKNTANKDASFAIGVTSEWGNGKTSFLNLIKRNLKRNLDHDKKQRVIIDYNPWLNSDRKSATLSFFDEMSSALRAYDSSLSNDILKYAKMLIDSSAGKYANLLNACLSLDGIPTLRERFEEINDAIKRTRLQIIVFIDDIDRLYDSEILEVLSLIRNSANFSNTIFIVAYDRNYLVAALKKVNNYCPQDYLEKIFQLELPLPQYEKGVLIEILQNKLNAYFDNFASCKYSNYGGYERDKKDLNNILFDSRLFYSAGIKTIRDVYRLVNSFLVSYDLLKGEIILSDLLNLELLKVKYPQLYELLASKTDDFLRPKEPSYNGELVLSSVIETEDKFAAKQREKLDKNDKYGKTLFVECIDSRWSNDSSLKYQLKEANEFVEFVFPIKKYRYDSKSITSATGIKRYFHYSLLNGNLSEIEFGNLRKDKSDSNYWLYIKEHAHKTIELKGLLDGAIYNDGNDYKRILCSYLYLAYMSDPKFYFWLMEGVFDMFVNSKGRTISTDDVDINVNSLLQNENTELFVDILLKYLFTKEFFGEFNNSKFFFKLCAGNWFDIFAKNIIQINEPDLTQGSDLSFSSSEPVDRKFYKIKPVISKTFQDWAKFESFINGLDETRFKGLKEFKDFYQRLKKANFREIKYDFKVIKL